MLTKKQHRSCPVQRQRSSPISGISSRPTSGISQFRGLSPAHSRPRTPTQTHMFRSSFITCVPQSERSIGREMSTVGSMSLQLDRKGDEAVEVDGEVEKKKIVCHIDSSSGFCTDTYVPSPSDFERSSVPLSPRVSPPAASLFRRTRGSNPAGLVLDERSDLESPSLNGWDFLSTDAH